MRDVTGHKTGGKETEKEYASKGKLEAMQSQWGMSKFHVLQQDGSEFADGAVS
jgi:hypothetical protein